MPWRVALRHGGAGFGGLLAKGKRFVKHAPVLLLFSLVFMLAACPGAGTAKALSTELVRGSHSLLPYLSWLVDEKGDRSIDEISSGPMQRQFTPMTREMALRGGGPVWVRLVLVKSLDGRGAAVPGQSRLYMHLGKLPTGKGLVLFSECPGPGAARGVWPREVLPG
mgnify:CR=1 FL=1